MTYAEGVMCADVMALLGVLEDGKDWLAAWREMRG